MPSIESPNRREYLASLVFVSAGAGCTRYSRKDSKRERYRLSITNRDSVSHNLRIQIRKLSDGEPVETVFDGIRVIGKDGDSIDLSKHVSNPSDYIVTITIDDDYTAKSFLNSHSKVRIAILSADRVRVTTESTE
jgi:hypothetical protein